MTYSPIPAWQRQAIRFAPEQLIYAVEVGAHAYGLADAQSDHDVVGIFVLPLSRFLADFTAVKETVVMADGSLVYHEVGKFLRLALKGNPTIIEVLWAGNAIYTSSLGEELLGLRKSLLHKGILRAYFGYYDAQMARLKRGQSLHAVGGKWNPKYAVHMLRLMIAAKHLAKTGEPLVHLEDKLGQLEMVMLIKQGKIGQEEAIRLGDAARLEAHRAEEKTKLPEVPDLRTMKDFLWNTRLSSLLEGATSALRERFRACGPESERVL